jgi:hypothetical protein
MCVFVCAFVCACVHVCVCVCICVFVCTHVKPARDHPPHFSLSLSLSHAVCAFLYTSHMHAPPVCLICLPNTPYVHGGEAALARVYSLALQCPALIHLIDCMACDYSKLCCSGSWRCTASFSSKELLGCTRGYRFGGEEAKDYKKAIGIVRYLRLHSFLALS